MTFVKRLRSMTRAEIACRAQQRARQWWDTIAPAFGPSGERRVGVLPTAATPLSPDAARRFFDGASRRFFPGASVDGSGDRGTFLGPKAWRKEILSDAEAIRQGRFDVLGYRSLSFGDPIDWHRDPVSGVVAPLRHWSRIDPLDAATVGDSKVIWELNRHQWMVTLGQAYRLTGDDRHAQVALDRLDEWMAANPYPNGINWSSSLEASLRVIAWCWAMFLLRGAAALDDARLQRWQTLMHAHASHVERYLSRYYSPNTHLTGEALGLVYAGVVFADNPDAARWRDVGRQILIDELRRQVLPDGVQFEQATCYQRYTADIYLHFLLLAKQNHLALPADVIPAVRRLVRALMALMQPDHSLPSIGDADGGWLVPLSRRDPSDGRGTFSVAAMLFDDPECAWAAGEWTPELFWMWGASGEERYRMLPKRPPSRAASALLADGGYAVMRSDWGPSAHQATFDVGPLGCTVSGAHGHADLLSLQCAAFGEPLIVDPGTYSYAGDRRWRRHFRSTTAHNTVVVDARSQAEPAGPFSWQARPCARLVEWDSTPEADAIEAVHEAYPGVTHRRRVLFLKPDVWVVLDDLSGDGDHRAELRFQFAAHATASVVGRATRVAGRRGSGLWMHTEASTPIEHEIRRGSREPIDGWVSPAYGVLHPAPVLIVHVPTWQISVCIVTTILCLDPLGDTPPSVQVLRDIEGAPSEVQLPNDVRRVRFDAASFTVEQPAGRQYSA